MKAAILCALIAASTASAAMAPNAGPSETVSILNPELYRAVIEQKEIRIGIRHVSDQPLPTYKLSSAVFVASPPAAVKKLLGNYAALKAMSPYFRRVEYRAAERVLLVTGNVLGYDFGAAVRVEDRSSRRIRYTALAGPSQGMGADVFLEPHRVAGSEGTITYLEAEFRVLSSWIPRFVVEKASRLIIQTIAARMRQSLEAKK